MGEFQVKPYIKTIKSLAEKGVAVGGALSLVSCGWLPIPMVGGPVIGDPAPSSYQIQTINSNLSAIPGLHVEINSLDKANVLASDLTDTNGACSFHESEIGYKFHVSITDIDGITNGSYQPTNFVDYLNDFPTEIILKPENPTND